MQNFTPAKVEKMIYIIRGQKVMLDHDLASLYGVETKRLTERVRRNARRFPGDFMFYLTWDEYKSLKPQIASSNDGRGGKRKPPMVFTENGVAMLSGILSSVRAIDVNIAIMRIFTKLRHLLAADESLADRLEKLEKGSDKLFRIVFERLDALEINTPLLPPNRKKLGL